MMLKQVCMYFHIYFLLIRLPKFMPVNLKLLGPHLHQNLVHALSLFYKVIEKAATLVFSNKQQEKLLDFYLGLPAHTYFMMAHSVQINLV